MVDTSELESFLNEKSAKEGDECVILTEGVMEEKQDQITKRVYKVLNIPVLLVKSDREVLWTPNKDAIRVLQKDYGLDSNNWVNVHFVIKFYPKTAFGKTTNAILPVLINEKVAKL